MGSELRIQAFDDPSWDPMATLGQFLGVGIVLDPYPQVAALRRQAPVHRARSTRFSTACRTCAWTPTSRRLKSRGSTGVRLMRCMPASDDGSETRGVCSANLGLGNEG